MAILAVFGGFYGHKMANLGPFGLKIGLPINLDPNDGQNKYQVFILKIAATMSNNRQNLTHMPIYGHTTFGHNSVIFWPIKFKFHMVTQETSIYRLVMRNQG